MIVAILFAGGVCLGALAVSSDVGKVMWERRQLQNAADASAMAIAGDCAGNAAGCAPLDSAALARIGALGDDNANDGAMDLSKDQICASPAATAAALGVSLCTSSGAITDLTECLPKPGWLTSAGSYVETRPRTLGSKGETLLPTDFARTLAGGSPGGRYTACARAAWGPPGGTGATLPITIGACDWANKTQIGGVAGQKYAPSPPYQDSPPGSSSTKLPAVIADGGYATGIFTHDSGDHKCSGSPGQEYPGGFGFLDATPGCVANIAATGTVQGSTGASLPNNCKGSMDLQKYVGTEVFIPVFVEVSDNGKYKISGVASFFLAGFANMPAANPDKSFSVYDQPAGVCTGKCNASVSYIWGWFTSGQKPLDSISLGTVDRGARLVLPAG